MPEQVQLCRGYCICPGISLTLTLSPRSERVLNGSSGETRRLLRRQFPSKIFRAFPKSRGHRFSTLFYLDALKVKIFSSSGLVSSM